MREWPIVKQAVQILGVIMRGLFLALSYIGIENIALCIFLFVIFSKFILLPSTYKKQKFSLLAPKLLPSVEEKIKKYENRLEHPLAKNKLNIDKGYILDKVSVSSSGGCLMTLIQLPVLLALYGIVSEMHIFVPELNQMSEAELANAYSLFMFDIRDVPGFEFSPLFVFPILTAVLQLLETFQSSYMQKTANNGKLAGGISNALILAMMFYFAATLPVVCSLYWIARSIVDIAIIFLLQTYIKSKPLEFFEAQTLKRKNKNRAKRGLAPLVA